MANISGGNGFACSTERPQPTIEVFTGWSERADVHEIGDITALCFVGFDFPIVAEMVGPDGAVRTNHLDFDPEYGGGLWKWITLPGDPEGVYTVSVQGDTREANFRVVAARERRVWMYVRDGEDLDVWFAHGPVGSPVGAVLTGFAPGSDVDLHFYGPQEDAQPCQPGSCRGATYPYISTAPVRVDDLGQALYEFDPAQDTIGRFCVDVAVGSEPVFGGDTVEQRCRQWAGVFSLEAAAAETAGLDLDLDPTYGSHRLDTGFTPDPASWRMTSGGSVDVSYLGADCVGSAATAPDLSLDWRGDGAFLRVYFVGEGDTTLVINDPNTAWYCADDSYGTADPSLDFSGASSGRYDIWVASYNQGESVNGTLFVTEIQGQHP